MKSIMLEEKVVYVFCGSRKSFCHSTKVSVGMGNEEEDNTMSLG